jgi:sulfatase maturation enzyme AslB (radical SAM superfamily)
MAEGDILHSDQHLREAREVAVFGEGAQIELQLGHVCNNRCVFCVSGLLTEQRVARPIDAEPVFAALRHGAAQGVKRVTFLGGEPTTQQSFLPAVALAVELGYGPIVIFTNGVKTRKAEFVDQVLALGGRYEWRFSVQGGTRQAHDAVTERPGSYDRIIAGMRHVRARGQDLTINMCVNERSYRSVVHFPALCAELGVRQLHIDQIRPKDAGARSDAYLASIMTPYEVMAPYFDQMLQGFEALDPEFDVNLGNFPYCLLPQWAHKIHHDGQLTYTYPADHGGLSAAFDKYPDKRADKHHPPQCAACVFRPDCNGVFDKYAQLHGTDAFAPVARGRLAALDTRGRFFVAVVGPELDPLLAASAPAPWRAADVQRNSRDRVIEVRYRDADERGATLVFEPADAPRPRGVAVLASPRYRVALVRDRGVAPGSALALLSWARERLAQAPGAALTELEPASLAAAGLLARERLGRGRRRIARLVAAVARRGRFAGWDLVGTLAADQGVGAVLTIAGADGGRVELVLELQADPARPLVGVRYRLAEGTCPDAARPVIGALMDALRAPGREGSRAP